MARLKEAELASGINFGVYGNMSRGPARKEYLNCDFIVRALAQAVVEIQREAAHSHPIQIGAGSSAMNFT